ncbi:hypothetical protein VJJ19_07375, partial [Parvimonas sp. D4]|uniref:hypothetical protein n=1 Tax=Parvimonas sp. D4 TaxID=3110690 RepID=UPI002B45AC0D
NAYFKGIAGYSITVKETGTSTAMANEAATLISGKSYQIANAAKRIIDYNVAVVVMDGGTNVTAQLQSIDYLSGTVVFIPTFTPAGAITVSGSYLPLVNIANGKSMTVTQQAAEIDESDYETLYANDGWRVFSAGLRTVSLEIG